MYIGEVMPLMVGILPRISWDAVTIAWDNGQVAIVHHGDMREIERSPTRPTTV